MAASGGMKSRLDSHAQSETKRDLWTHFSIFEVWDNLTASEITELGDYSDTSIGRMREPIASIDSGVSRKLALQTQSSSS
jgi:hypothetical protein